jgi:hypothetical protein
MTLKATRPYIEPTLANARALSQATTKRRQRTIKIKSDLMTEHLYAVERWLGRRLTQAELRSAKFTESRDLYVAAGLMWK